MPKSLWQAWLDVMSEMPNDPALMARANRGSDIIEGRGEEYTIDEYLPSKFIMVKVSSQAQYHVDLFTCTCPDYPSARGNLCKHRLAAMLLLEMRK